MIAANSALAIDPHTTVTNPALVLRDGRRIVAPRRPPAPTFSTSAAATPSGYGRSLPVTIARRSGTLYITPRMPPTTQMPNDCQNGNPVHQPIMTRPGSTKMIEESVPAADATVWTMLFSQIVALRKPRRTAIEITAAGIDDANVSPTFSPRYTLAAVNSSVIRAPRTTPRSVSSTRASRDAARRPMRRTPCRASIRAAPVESYVVAERGCCGAAAAMGQLTQGASAATA